MVVYIAGDNGTSGEGGANGMFNEYTYFNGVQETVAQMLPKIDQWGGPETYPHMASGWAVGFDSPFGWMKQVPSDFGGTRNGMVMSWPKGIKAKNGIRTQFGHVIDVAPTILEAIGLPEPKVVNGTPQIPMEGTSLVYTFDDPKAKERHTTQYFEIAGNRGIYHDGWFARTIHGRRGKPSRVERSRTTARGSCTTRDPISAWPTTSRRRIRRSLQSYRRYSCTKQRSITCCRWTIVFSSAWMALRSVAPTSWLAATRSPWPRV